MEITKITCGGCGAPLPIDDRRFDGALFVKCSHCGCNNSLEPRPHNNVYVTIYNIISRSRASTRSTQENPYQQTTETSPPPPIEPKNPDTSPVAMRWRFVAGVCGLFFLAGVIYLISFGAQTGGSTDIETNLMGMGIIAAQVIGIPSLGIGALVMFKIAISG